MFIFSILFSFSPRAKNNMDHTEFMFLLTGGVGLENKLANPAPDWLSDKSWDEICRMCDLRGFKVKRGCGINCSYF